LWKLTVFVGRLAEVKISRLLSLRRKFLYDLTVKGEEERGDALQEMERLVNLEVESHQETNRLG
jgi:hypothetical protein